MKKKLSIGHGFAFLIVLLGGITMVLPFIWMLSTSLKESNLVYTIPPQWIPRPFDWSNYVEVWKASGVLTGIRNSVIVSVTVVAFNTITSSMSAFAFAKLRFPGKKAFFMMVLATRMVEEIMLIVPLYIVYSKIGWIDTLWPLIVPLSLCEANNIFFMKQFLTGVPNAVLDAALIDGCSFWGAFWKIYFPLCKPAIISNTIVLFMKVWNDYIKAVFFVHSPSKQTLQVAIAMMSSHFEQQTDVPLVMCASLISLLPVLIVFIICQKYFVDSFALTGVKG